MDELDQMIYGAVSNEKDEPALIKVDLAISIIDTINETLIFGPVLEWDVKGFKASMEFLLKNAPEGKRKGKVWLFVRDGRNLSRLKADGSFSDAPDTGRGETALPLARKTPIDIPALLLIRQNGKSE